MREFMGIVAVSIVLWVLLIGLGEVGFVVPTLR